ncbi:MAG TPA: sugar ABC transporter ATP-binding protein [Vicinamibacterales bacterium]|nr:sugar ABC transporter ATP-binding protein [Vicinamibacterales bacterium]
MTTTTSAGIAVSCQDVTKRFPGVTALDRVTFDIAAGSCHALCGENGAGKSTLGKLLAGIHTPDEGAILLDGRPVRFTGPTAALAAGVAMVHQELAFCENLSVAENLCLGSLPTRNGFLSTAAMRARAEAMLAQIDVALDVRRPVGALTIGQQQMLQIASAIGQGARLIVFDEPTSSLSQHEAERLYALIARLKARGVTCIYVSHRLEEIFLLCDTITVLRDGRHVATTPVAAVDRGALVEMMIGRRVEDYFPAHATTAAADEMLRVEKLSSPAGFRDVSFAVRAGEVVGFAGLVGAGRSEIAQALFGLDPNATGTIRVRGRAVRIGSAARAIELGIGLVPEDRKRQGLVLSMTVLDNATLSILPVLSRMGFITPAIERDAAVPYFDRLRVKTPRLDTLAAALSGGNQQKIVLTKWLAARCPILILDEPTRGVDVGAKAEIHALIDELAAAGNAVLLISSEMPEVLNLSSRILVFREGRLVGELSRAEANQDLLLRLMAGVGN